MSEILRMHAAEKLGDSVTITLRSPHTPEGFAALNDTPAKRMAIDEAQKLGVSVAGIDGIPEPITAVNAAGVRYDNPHDDKFVPVAYQRRFRVTGRP
jgi:hypothetical protein